MRYVPFILKHLRRNWIRTTSTILAMSVCIFLFCTLQTVIEAVNWGLNSGNASRLVTRHAVSLVFNLPLTYQPRIAAVPGVKRVAVGHWFAGMRGDDFRNFFPNLAVESETYLAMHPEFILKPEERQAFLQDMRGCIIGRDLADRFGWKVGDSFQLESFIPPYRKRDRQPFEFVVQGIFDTDPVRYPGTDLNLMLFHFKYLYEGVGQRIGAGWCEVEIDDPQRAGAVSKAIDAMFENSDAQTKTETEQAFRAGFVAMAGNLALLLNSIGLAVAFTILLVTANTMSMAVRERRTEIAVLKTLGFPSGLVMGLILGEALAIGLLGGGLGIVLGRGMIQVLPKIPFLGDVVRTFPGLGLSAAVALEGLGLAVALGLAAGFVPAAIAYRARVTDMLRQA